MGSTNPADEATNASLTKEELGLYAWGMGDMLSAGVPVVEALLCAEKVFWVPRLKLLSRRAHDHVLGHGSFAAACQSGGPGEEVDQVFIDFVDVGEETGDLDSMLLLYAADALADAKECTLATAMGRTRQVRRFTDLLLPLQQAGLPLLRSVRVVQQRPGWDEAAEDIDKLAAAIETGESLDDFIKALRECETPLAFDPMYIEIVQAGIRLGKLDLALQVLARQSRPLGYANTGLY